MAEEMNCDMAGWPTKCGRVDDICDHEEMMNFSSWSSVLRSHRWSPVS